MSQELIVQATIEGQNLTKLQRQFNELVLKISEKQDEIQHNEAMLSYEQRQISAQLVPMLRKMHATHFEAVKAMDKVIALAEDGELKLSRREQDTIEEMIEWTCFRLLKQDTEVEGVLAMYDRYADLSFEDAIAAEKQDTINQVQDIMLEFGLDIEYDTPLDDPKAFVAYLKNKLTLDETYRSPEKDYPMSAKRLAKAEKLKAEEKSISKTVRDVYTSLAKSFHPDLEQDEDEKLRKTEIMKAITEAYQQGDLPALLRLQLEYEQIDKAKIAAMADEQLKRYTKILKKQLDSLNEEADTLFNRFLSTSVGMGKLRKVSEEHINRLVKEDLKSIKNNIAVYDNEIKVLRNPQYLNMIIKHYRDILSQEQGTEALGGLSLAELKKMFY